MELVLAALDCPTRRRILTMLRMKGLSVAEVTLKVNSKPGESCVPFSRPTISQHLHVLEKARLVQCRQQGTRHIYQLDRRGFDELRKYLDSFEGIPGFPKAPDGLFLSQLL
jgi:DNA-binding transcriptional ArsR family regulator